MTALLESITAPSYLHDSINHLTQVHTNAMEYTSLELKCVATT